MFAKWTVSKVKNRANLKTSLVNRLKANAVKSIPRLTEIEDDIFPKKRPVIVHNLGDHCSMYSVDGHPLLVELGDGTVFPFLRIAIEYPGLLKSVFCYDEAAMALLRGAKLMARGTWGADETYKRGDIVQICMIGTRIPFAVGRMEMDGADIAQRRDGAAVCVLHILRDGLWDAKKV